ncbi:DUF177 domain-containing protein [Meiothermus sp. QL-1]|uniref:YceD family protein n=1 Tax=Meiothermus sp. QL-1 TaxID=2058095 RepID=UPI000E0B813A|nr:DUF177 domain-containing protein [Meiothermus sp. QL-1]RDI95607.1 DUF177 domain-containing protein [Meiothermus sp. QL-1]
MVPHFPSINLSRLLREGGTASAQGEITEAILVEQERIPLHTPARWRVSVTRLEREQGQAFWLSGEVAGYALMECRRCLAPTPTPVRAHFQYLLRYVAGLAHPVVVEEDEEDVLLFGHPNLDLSLFLSEAFALELPYTVLCREDCKGLCPVCGANRNEVDCGHREGRTRLAEALARLLQE